jgi:hypothetical protein
MSKIKIFLRSVNCKDKKALALFDSERNGCLDDLVTTAKPGDLIIWKLDKRSGLKGIEAIYPKEKGGTIFSELERSEKIQKKIKYRIPKDASGEEAYGIKYVLCDGSKLDIDPKIKIIPPHDDE